MKIFTACFIWIILGLGNLTAQNSQLSLSYGLGIPIPVGDFRSEDFDNAKAGFAGGGFGSSLKLDYNYMSSKLGISAAILSQANSFKTDEYEWEMTKLTPGSNWNIFGQSYLRSAFLFGPNFTDYIAKNTKMGLTAMIGASFSTLPELTISESTTGIWIVQTQTSTSSFCYQLGANFFFKLTNKLDIFFDINYFSSNPKFSNVSYYKSDGDIDFGTVKMPMTTVSINTGLCFKLIQ